MSISDKSDTVRDDTVKAFVLAAGFGLDLASSALKRLGEVANRLAGTLEALAESMEDTEIPPPPAPPTGGVGASGPYPPPPPPHAPGVELRPNGHGVVPGVPIS